MRLIFMLAACRIFPGVSALDDGLRVYPGTIVFRGTEGKSIDETRLLNIFNASEDSTGWSQSTDVPWITTDSGNGITDGILKVGVDDRDLEPGVYQGNIMVTSAQTDALPVIVGVSLIINPDVPVKITTWKDDYDGAMSVSVDDGYPTAFDALIKNGYEGTYVSNGMTPPSFYTDYYNAGMELGSHLVNHICYPLQDDLLSSGEIKPNVDGICSNTPEPCSDVISLVWPCGVTNYREQSVASDYFLSARGYNINELEEATPGNFMNLKSYNSHEHTPFPPADLKSIVDSALDRHKWFNLVLHSMTNDDGAIEYAHSKNIWVKPIGTVIKYILQRDRFILAGYNENEDHITFDMTRLRIPSSSVKNFEDAFGPKDQVTMQVDMDDRKIVGIVLVNGDTIPYDLKIKDGNEVILVNIRPEPEVNQTVEIKFLKPYRLLESYPNPNHDYTWMEFNLIEDTQVSLEIYNALGQKVETILNQTMSAGNYKFKWITRPYPAGTYYLSLKTNKYKDAIKMTVIK